MADEVRRSGRANKGHHTKNADALDEVAAKPKQQGKQGKKAQPPSEPARSQSVQSGEPQQGEEDDAIYRCVCGDQREIRGREMIMCDKCEAWQHNKCLGLPDSAYWEDKTYLCEQCKPEDHAELLAAMARGEKPWNRKKGAKSAKPKFRPSDVGSIEATPEKKDTATPQPTPTPAPAGEEPPEVSNGQAEAKPSKKASPKVQIPHPSEKRAHDAIAEKDATPAKRRKSAAPQQQKTQQEPTQPAPTVADAAALPEKQRAFVDKLVTSLTASIKEAAKSRGYQVPDGATPASIATQIALQVDQAAVEHFGAPTQNSGPYPERFRAILSNTKKNVILVDRLLSGSLSGGDIATMPIEEMASEDKQKEFAVLKEKAEKQMVLTEETGPRLRKTHKGEEIVGEDSSTIEHDYKPPDQRTRESVDEGKPAGQQSPTADGAQVELPEDSARRPLAVDTAGAQASTDTVRRPSTTFDVNSVFDKIRSPQQDQQAFNHRRQSSRPQQTPQENAVVDADIDRLLKDEDGDVDMGGYSADPTVVWRGALDMQSLGPFDAVGRFVAGGDFGQVIPWDQLLVPSLPILGRIESAKGNDYIEGLAISGSYDVGVLSVTPVTPDGQRVFDQLFNYFQPRDRWGVVPVDRLQNEAMRDLYVIPIQPGGSELPPFLNMLEYCTIETPRQQPLILLALVAKLPEQKPPTQPYDQYTPGEHMHGQAAPPVAPPVNGGPGASTATNPHGPSYSPVQPSFSPAQSFGAQYPPPQQGHNGYPPMPPHLRNPKALEIFGPYIEAPVIVQLLTANPEMSDVQMGNLRHIIDNVPAARTDLGVLQSHLIKGTDAQQA